MIRLALAAILAAGLSLPAAMAITQAQSAAAWAVVNQEDYQ